MTRLLAVSSIILLLCGPAAAQTPGHGATAPPATVSSLAPGSLQPTAHNGPSSGSFLQSLRRDFAGTVTSDNLLLLGIGASGALGSHALDGRLSASHWGRDSLFRPGALVGSVAVQGGGALATYLVGRAFDAPQVSTLGAELIRAQIVSQTIAQGIKFTTTRRRPDGTSLSLPSGHTASAFATATVLQSHYGWKVGAPAYAVAAWVGASRMQMRRHYLSDVIAGAAIGLAAGRSVTVGRGNFRFAMTPIAAPGGAGLNFVRISSR